MPSSPGGSRSCTLDSSVFPGILRPHDRDRNSRRRRSGSRWDGRSAWRAVWGRRWLSRDPAAGVFLWHGSANGAGHRLDNGGAQCRVGIFALSATLWHRSAHGRDHRRVGSDCDLSDARLATGLDPHVLRLAFALFLAPIAATVAYHTWRGGARVAAGPTRAWGWITVGGLIGGAFSGFFGVGGAFVAPPLLTTFFGLRQLEAQGLALALVSPSALVALLAYAEAGRVDWLVGLPLALGGIAAISAGVKFASRLPERRMRLAFCGLLLLTAVLLALRG